MNTANPPNPAPARISEAKESRETTTSPLALWSTVRKNWVLVVAIATAVFLGVAFFTLAETKQYQATAVILFDPQPPRPLGDRVETVVDTGQSFWSNKEYYKTQYWVIQSPRIASEVVRSLGLNKDPTFIKGVSANRRLPPQEVSVEDATQILIARMKVEPIKDSRLAQITLQDGDPARAAHVVSALVETYVQRNLDDMSESTSSAADWLHNQLGSLKRDLESSEMRLHEYKRDKNILSLSMDDQTNMLRDQMKQLNLAIADVQTRREQARARRDQLLKVNPTDPQDLPATELIQSPVLQTLRESYVDSLRELEGLIGGGKGENHPDVRVAAARRDTMRDALLTEVKNIQGAVQRDLAELDEEESGLNNLFHASENRALDLNLLEIEYDRLARSKDNNEKLYELVLQRSKESDLTRTLMFNNIRVAERPAVPMQPVSPDVPINMLAGAVAGLVLGLGAALGREQLDRSVKTPDDAERVLGLPFLGLLPALAGSHISTSSAGRHKRTGRRAAASVEDEANAVAELVVHQQPTSGIAEAARAIRTNILFMSPDRPYRTLLVTSAGPSEGKTTVACCIATAMAQAGRRVAILDCDMRRPRLHRVFGVSKETGVTTALLDLSTVDSIVHSTVVPNLSVVTTGPLPPNPAEILHSEAFGKLMAALRERFDCIVIDSPPVVPVTDAAVLSTSVDGTILVVRAFETSKDLARRAVRALQDVGGHLVGSVLNAVDLDRAANGYRYYQYYYYRNEGYSSQEAEEAARTAKHPSA